MKKGIVIFIIALSISSQLKGSILNRADAVKKNKYMLGIGSGLEFNNNYMCLGSFEYGISHIINFILKTGYLNDENFYIQGLVRFLVTERFGGTDNLVISAGGHYSKKPGFDTALFIGDKVKSMNYHLGFDFSFNFPSNNSDKLEYPGSFVMGLSFYLNFIKKLLTVEFNVPVTSYRNYILSAGIFI